MYVVLIIGGEKPALFTLKNGEGGSWDESADRGRQFQTTKRTSCLQRGRGGGEAGLISLEGKGDTVKG